MPGVIADVLKRGYACSWRLIEMLRATHDDRLQFRSGL